MRRRSFNKFSMVMIGIAILLFIIVMIRMLFGLGGEDPTDAVHAFYQFEQEGDFGSAWELFHPVMQERFPKNAYVTERSHIYMSHYGVSTFAFELGEEEEVKGWKMEKGGKGFSTVCRVEVQQTFKSKFGKFKVIQNVFVVKDKEEWKIAWQFE
ncbi:hypothetical protein WQ54_27250 [Bacillus sp. SA1-12]|uniref:hypothetical protein n=1 Tax=Bacillus sp. SA1-12 TaxID=1455638 RepID=UPI00062703D9|nr:hypothetical protein [Bacillus sp. SA1-12]KKI89257.1 hypothetical protein WQ54_27250 [Bacillus sp. SA1-12]